MSTDTKMQAYIGSKIILASPMSRKAFCNHQGKMWGGKQDEAGYIVQYAGKDNYQSWSPKDVFEEAYRMVSKDEVVIINNKDN